MKVKPRNQKRLWLIIGGVILAVAAASVTVALLLHLPVKQEAKQEIPAVVEPQPVSLTANTLFFGNVYWGRYINDWSMASPLKTAYPFSRLNEFQRDQYDAWIAGLECPTVAGFTQTSREEDTTLSFNCSPDYLPEAAKWFTAFSLANNHTDNRGEEGFVETQTSLDANNIQHFGHYDPYLTENACEVIALPVTVTYDDASTKKQAIPVAMCAYHGVFKIPPDAALAEIQKYSQYMPVIAMPHMGVEYQPGPDQLKTATYRKMIDYGADIVLGDHPHWVQSSEAYKGKLIVYSMGNFIFDQQDTQEVTRSAAIRVVVASQPESSNNLKQWLTLGETCKTFKDDCLQKAVSGQYAKLPTTFQFGVIGTDNAGKIVKPATPAQQASIEQRLNWQTTMNGLQSPQSSL